MTPLAMGRIVMWQGGSLWTFDVPEPPPGAPQQTDFHAHHALQITLALDGMFELFTADVALAGPAVVVAPDVSHAFKPRGLIGLLFVEPESPAGRAISRTLVDDAPARRVEESGLGDFPKQLKAAVLDGGEGEVLRDLGRGLVRRLVGEAQTPGLDSRIARSIDWAMENLDGRVSASAAAAHVGLSVDRMSHLFVQETGLQFRTYLLWLRLSRAVERYAAGASLTEAAHEAGFSDSAHFSRTFRRMFGVAAAELMLR